MQNKVVKLTARKMQWHVINDVDQDVKIKIMLFQWIDTL